MYYCAITGKLSKPCEKLHKIVVETRTKSYLKWVYDEESRRYNQVDGGTGYETVKEIDVSEEGLRVWTGANDDERAAIVRHLRA